MPRVATPSISIPIALFVCLVGCTSTPNKPPLMATLAQQDVSVSRLRAMDYEYAARFGEMVAATAMDIAAHTENPAIRDMAYQWRMWGRPQARSAAFDEDPLAGLLELWALAGQQLQYFTDGAGTRAFGDQQDRAIEAAAQLEHKVRDLAASVMPRDRFETLSEKVEAWVAKHPMEGRFYVRPTARADLAALVSEESKTGFQAVGSIDETFRDLNARLTIVSAELPEEARWQAEYLVNALFEDRVEPSAHAVVSALEDIDGYFGEFEGTLSSQTGALLDGLARERMALSDAVEQERAAILDGLGRQGTSAIAALDERLVATTARLEETGRSLIDHFFVRLTEVLLGAGAFVLATVALILWVVRRRSS